MWRYKTAMIATAILIAITIISDLSRSIAIFSYPVVYWSFNSLAFIFGMLFFYNLIVILKKNNELIWLGLPFYGFMLIRLMYDVAAYLIPKGNPLVMSKYYAIMFIPNILLYVFLLISVFKIKNKFIARYYKIFSFTTIGATIVAMIVPVVLGLLFLGNITSYIFYNRLLIRPFIYAPMIVVLIMQYKLYIMNEAFPQHPDQSILIGEPAE